MRSALDGVRGRHAVVECVPELLQPDPSHRRRRAVFAPRVCAVLRAVRVASVGVRRSIARARWAVPQAAARKWSRSELAARLCSQGWSGPRWRRTEGQLAPCGGRPGRANILQTQPAALSFKLSNRLHKTTKHKLCYSSYAWRRGSVPGHTAVYIHWHLLSMLVVTQYC